MDAGCRVANGDQRLPLHPFSHSVIHHFSLKEHYILSIVQFEEDFIKHKIKEVCKKCIYKAFFKTKVLHNKSIYHNSNIYIKRMELTKQK